MSYPLISIIVRTYNRPHLLPQALHALAQQNYRPLEIIVVNDGGIDVGYLINEFKEKVEYLRLCQLPQQMGRATAANSGLELANGQFIGFLDDDDLLNPEHITELYTAIQRHSVSVVYAGVRAMSYDASDHANPITEFCVPFDKERLYVENFIPIHAVLFAREFIDKGCRFDTNFELFEDWDFWLQLSQYTDFYCLNHITATYRLNTQSSNLHSPENRFVSTMRIYAKWLSNWPDVRLHQLLARMHEFKDTTIAALQKHNESKLQAIGEQHSYACKLVEERDCQLQEFVKRHDYALNIINERDRQLQTCAEQHDYALKIINERDKQLQEFVERYDYAVQVIKEKDQLLTYIHNNPIGYILNRIYKKLRN